MSKSAHSPASASSQAEFVTHWPSLIAAILLIGVVVSAAVLWLIGFAPSQPDRSSMAMAGSSNSRAESKPSPRLPRQELADEELPTGLFSVESASAQPAATIELTVLEGEDELDLQVVLDSVDNSLAEEATRPEPTDLLVVPDPIVTFEPPVQLPAPLPDRLDELQETQLVAWLGSHVTELNVVSVQSNEKGLLDAVISESVIGASSPHMDEQRRLVGAPEAGAAPHRSGISGLPLRKGSDCQLDGRATESLAEASRKLSRERFRLDRMRQQISELYSIEKRRTGRRSVLTDAKESDAMSRYVQELAEAEYKFTQQLGQEQVWRRDRMVPALEQILQVDSTETRVQLVKILSQINSEKAAHALARRALYDPSPDVRDAAGYALAARPVEQFRRMLLDGFRYPWAPVAQHAAETLVAVNDQGVVGQLVDLLDEPNPARPHKDPAGNWVVKELVCVNHLRSCVLCHAASPDRSDPVRGVIPTPGKPLPRAYYNSRRGNFVRADVTYLKQDFSVPLEVPKAHPWPGKQRFDFFVRTRQVDEPARKESPDEPSYPQRGAVLFALQKLTGKNAGNSSETWRRAMQENDLQY